MIHGRLIGIVLGVALATGAVRSQVGSPSAAPGHGLIVGQVIDAADGWPIAGATVSFSGGPPLDLAQGATALPRAAPARFATASRVLADAQGRFVFAALPAGMYTITATAPGYIGGAFGQKRPSGPSLPIVLAADQKLDGVVIALWKFAAITGTVVDEAGDPVVGAVVRALRRQVSGRRMSFVQAETDRTDDRGIYRISVTPGEYVVAVPSSTTTMPVSLIDEALQAASARDNGASSRALTDQLRASGAPWPGTRASGTRVGDLYVQPAAPAALSPMPPSVRNGGVVFVQPTVFFPGANAAGGAAPLTLAPGVERTNVDFQLAHVRAYRVAGSLTGPDGPAAHFGVRLVPAELDDFTADAGLEVATTVTAIDGRFTLMGVPPGAYQLRVLRAPRLAGLPASANPWTPTMLNGASVPPPAEPTLFAQTGVTVGETDVTGLSISLRVGPRLSGRVEFEGSSPKPALDSRTSPLTITLRPADGRATMGYAFVQPDGQFTTMSLPPGRYLVSSGAPGWTLKSAVLNGRDAADVPVELESNDVGGLVVTFFDRPASVRGTVLTSRGEPDPASTVTLLPADYRSWLEDGMSARRSRVARTAADGRFSLSGLLPGEYLIVATNEDLLGRPDAAGLIETIAAAAVRLSLGESARQMVELTTKSVR